MLNVVFACSTCQRGEPRQPPPKAAPNSSETTEMSSKRPPAPGAGDEDVQALRAALEERDQKVAAMQEKLNMSKEALQGHKEKHAEKVQKLEHLVLQLRQKMSESATGEGDSVWAQRLAEERERRDALQSELDRLALMFERVETQVQAQILKSPTYSDLTQ